MVEVLVIGAGLSGLVAAAHLHAAGRRVVVLEARDRVGGRTWSLPLGPEHVVLDLGAAWLWEEHTRVQRLVAECELSCVRQHEPGIAIRETDPDAPVERFEWPETPPPSWRVAAGMDRLAWVLAARLPPGALCLEHRVRAVVRTAEGVRIRADHAGTTVAMEAPAVVCAVPPRLTARTIAMEPPLPSDLEEAMRTTPTWMSRAAKVVATFDAPFWREHGLAGRVVSTAGPVHDWHDATTPDGHAALHGFMHPPGLSSPTPADPRARLDAIRRQLVHCFGPDASPTALFAWDWSGDPLTMPPGGSRSDPDEPPAPRPVLQRPRWDGRLHLAGAETATEHPGYLDGAIEAGTRAARRLLSS